MVLRGNICFSGFSSDDLHVQGAERLGGDQTFSNHSQVFFEKSAATGLDLENKVFFAKKNKKKYEFTILLLVIFQSCSSSLM